MFGSDMDHVRVEFESGLGWVQVEFAALTHELEFAELTHCSINYNHHHSILLLSMCHTTQPIWQSCFYNEKSIVRD